MADVARRHGTTRWQVYDWSAKLRARDLVLPVSVGALPMFAELVVEGARRKRRRSEPPPVWRSSSAMS